MKDYLYLFILLFCQVVAANEAGERERGKLTVIWGLRYDGHVRSDGTSEMGLGVGALRRHLARPGHPQSRRHSER